LSFEEKVFLLNVRISSTAARTIRITYGMTLRFREERFDTMIADYFLIEEMHAHITDIYLPPTALH